MRITSKGQVTIPQNVREQMGFLANTEVEFFVSDNKVFLQKAENDEGRGKDLIARMRGKGTVALRTDEILVMTRE
ncbi:MAG: AbrB/MazE/SpoVT family DNA-binding domain-containing protein [Deltaproteobacteria bacterium]|nr:MAG: AbrB/MazE/SpoVT family DNA-binding domain-containing protein [Deltaproteobacteria bacterium]